MSGASLFLPGSLAAESQVDAIPSRPRVERVTLVAGLDWGPSAAVLASLLSRYEPEVVECAIRDVAPKIATGYIPARGDQWIRYLNVVARNIAADDPATDESGAP